MFMLRRASERRHDQRGNNRVWLTFFGREAGDPLSGGFGLLERLDEGHLPPRAASRRLPGHGGVTYVREGALAYVSSTGHSGVIHAGEFQRITAASPGHVRETNASHIDSAQVFWIGLRRSDVELEPSHEQKRFTLAERRDGHVVQGQVALEDVVLTTGDGAGVTGELTVSLTARRTSEILLLDLGGSVATPSS